MISNENFMQKFTWLDNLKLRASLGEVGNDEGIPRWGYIGSWTQGTGASQAQTFIGMQNPTPNQYSPYPTFLEGTIANPDIRWETAIKKDLGLEFSAFQDRITFEGDLFQEHRKDIFMSANRRNIPNYFGAAPVPANLGETQTKGYELTLGYNKPNFAGFGYSVSLSMTQAKDIVLKSEDPAEVPDYQKAVGFQIGQLKTQVQAGYMNNWDEVYASSPAESNMNQRLPGDWDIVDYNGDGVINSTDNVAWGFPSRPQNTYNATLGANYKNLSVMVQFFAVNNINVSIPVTNPQVARWTAISESFSDYWTPDNPSASFKAPRLGTSSSFGQFYYVDGSYIRLKTAEIAYTFNGSWIKSLGISGARIALNGNNLIFWSKMPMDSETGYDPKNSYPTYKQYNLALQISF